jgi:trk system potassium uptake protein TrkA
MRVVIIGCGRTGSSVAKELDAAGWQVTCVDDDEASLGRLGEWRGGFVVGHAMDLETLERAGVAAADAVVVSTDGDNTNLVVAQVVKRRYDVGCVVVRILDPHRAALYAEWGLRTVCPTQTAIATVTDLVRTCETAPVGGAG